MGFFVGAHMDPTFHMPRFLEGRKRRFHLQFTLYGFLWPGYVMVSFSSMTWMIWGSLAAFAVLKAPDIYIYIYISG